MTINIKELDEQILKTWRVTGIINAIYLYARTTDTKLSDSVVYVENLLKDQSKTPLENETAMEICLEDDIIILIKEERKLEAVKLYIDKTNCSLIQGKNYVDALTEKFFIA